jgi:hypothetical protein
MNLFTTIGMVESLLHLAIEYEPQIEKDVKDILAIVDRIRNSLATQEGTK